MSAKYLFLPFLFDPFYLALFIWPKKNKSNKKGKNKNHGASVAGFYKRSATLGASWHRGQTKLKPNKNGRA